MPSEHTSRVRDISLLYASRNETSEEADTVTGDSGGYGHRGELDNSLGELSRRPLRNIAHENAQLSVEVLGDLLITVTLIIYLMRSRTGWKHTDQLIKKILV